jgi:hypothetical protein
MCKTSATSTAASDAAANAAAIPDKTITTLQKYLEKAYSEALVAHKMGSQPADDSTAKLHVPISIFAHVNSGSHHYAGIHHDEVHFSASLLKVAAMYAAFSLRTEARELAKPGAAPPGGFKKPEDFFDALDKKFKPADAVAAIRNAGVGLKPRYSDILTVTGFSGGGLTVNFSPDFLDHMRQMIIPSNNSSAGECIRRLGYAYINVKLMNGGFYDPDSSPPKGIWLAADFVGGARIEIDSVNDGKSAQATTSRQMARLFSLIQLEQLIPDVTSSLEMKAILREAQGVDSAWISRFGPRLFSFEGVKVGLANLKPNTPPKGPDVYSEGVLLKWSGGPVPLPHNLSGYIAVCWQNLRVSAYDTGVPGIAEMIEKAFSNFLNQAPL